MTDASLSVHDARLVRVTHVSTVHAQPDARIVVRECQSLVEEGYPVTVVGQEWQGVHQLGIDRVVLPQSPGRIARIAKGLPNALAAIRRSDPDVVHLHDPELLLLTPFLKVTGRRVIYDAHEDLPRQVLHKSYLPKWARPAIGLCASAYEAVFMLFVDRVVAATEPIAARFRSRRAVPVRNFPRMREFPSSRSPWTGGRASVIYVGGVSESRGATVMLEVGRRLSASSGPTLRLCGPIENESLRRMVEQASGSGALEYLGNMPRTRVIDELGNSQVGLALLTPTPAYREAYPVKVFEYLAAGIPVVLSDFPEWREVFGESAAFRYVDPFDVDGAVAAVRELVADAATWSRASADARAQFVSRFSWENEADRLLGLYREMLTLE